MRILAVDTCFGACSVALLDGEVVRAHRFALMERGHAEALAPMVDEAVRASGLAFADLERLAVTVGPGTFTGQRVGLAFMRGLRVALEKPLVGVTSLETMAHQAAAESGLARVAALHDARRDEVYLEIVENGVSVLGPVLLGFAEAVAKLGSQTVALCGTAAPRAKEAFAPGVLSGVRHPDALWVASIARSRPGSDQPPRPLYLRAPDAKLPGAA
jgi:tRNA threonylcarbamoyladenosine biosynthesis protein TsaB